MPLGLILYVALYLIAISLFLVGEFGLFGSEVDPLAGVFMIPLDVPWIFMTDLLPTGFAPWLGFGAPLINIVIIQILCTKRRKST